MVEGGGKMSAPQPAKPQCEEIKKKYDSCFKEWYTEKFLQGDLKAGCLDEWEVSCF